MSEKSRLVVDLSEPLRFGTVVPLHLHNGDIEMANNHLGQLVFPTKPNFLQRWLRKDSFEKVRSEVERILNDQDLEGLHFAIDSPGGYVTVLHFYEWLIQYFRDRDIKVTAHVTNHAHSAAACITLMADERVVPAKIQMLFHAAGVGDWATGENLAEHEAQIREILANSRPITPLDRLNQYLRQMDEDIIQIALMGHGRGNIELSGSQVGRTMGGLALGSPDAVIKHFVQRTQIPEKDALSLGFARESIWTHVGRLPTFMSSPSSTKDPQQAWRWTPGSLRKPSNDDSRKSPRFVPALG